LEFFWKLVKEYLENWACQYFQNYHELFPKLGNFDLKSSFGNFSCIENAFGTVKKALTGIAPHTIEMFKYFHMELYQQNLHF
jgi:hypothetical protein